ncbi:XRE family transcriptional regulator [Geomonas terrae]|uniref:XRE family transcriptional regulator n=1 Tax=Geomonas terrae TaxID=2562681 RepID=A0A4S1C9G0_9BACT|nr:helix-turn-helix transcriptional regulator [Geomonas terrae]TGU69917.1 XRE family transcriptional regulator [Geomonas terrae]
MKSTKQLLGARIKEIRRSEGLSQADLAEKLSIATNFVSRIEVGATYPSLDTLEKMARTLEVELKDFFDYDHLQGETLKVSSVEDLLKDASEEKLRLVFKVTKAIMR